MFALCALPDFAGRCISYQRMDPIASFYFRIFPSVASPSLFPLVFHVREGLDYKPRLWHVCIIILVRIVIGVKLSIACIGASMGS
jgi:hypothetical protein